MTRSERPESPRLATLVDVARAAVKPPGPAELDRGLGALRARVAAERGRVRVSFRRALYAAAILACVVAAVVLVPRFTRHAKGLDRPVAVSRIEGGKLLEGGYLSEVGRAGVKLTFNEGSEFVLRSGTRGRLRTVTSDGARFVLDHGTVAVSITPNAERHWWVEAGPFVVAVHGTEFTVVWDPASEELDVKVRQGRVAISGPMVGEELALRPGQNLTVKLPKAETVITQAWPDAAPEPSAAPASPPLPSASAVPAEAPTPTPSAIAPERRWKKALASGEWDVILADAERAGVDTSLRTLPADDLFALADAARYRRRPELARAALLAYRERFPGSPRSLDALFLLGRVEELRSSGRAAALERYDDYLARAPHGTYAAEALGRKMILVRDTQGPEHARRIAEQYLLRFPRGSYADAARTLSRAP